MANGVAQVCALLRYVILARILGPEQLGLAATLILTASFFDMISDTGGDRFIIQDARGDDPPAQKLVHLVLVCRGAATALALIVFAWPIALFYKTPALALGMATMSLSPFIMGFLHLDLRRVQRDNDFRPEALGMMVGESLGLATTVTAALVLRNYSAVIFGLVARSSALVLVSHLTAKRPYRIGFSREHAPSLTRFAAPLMFNGLVLFLGGQGDRVLVGRSIGVKGLGHYSAIMLLIYYPSQMIQRYVHAVFMPPIAAHQQNRALRDQVSDSLGGQTFLLAILMMAGFAVVAPVMVPLLYGRAFAETAPVIALIGFLQATRFLTVWPTTVALAMGRSGIVLASNLVRLAAWPCALIGAATLGGLSGIVAGFLFGEVISFCTALAMLNLREGRHLFHSAGRLANFLLAGACTLGWATAWAAGAPTPKLAITLSVATVVSAAWVLRSEAQAINSLRDIVRPAVASRLGRRASR
ncbi:MAG TPA: oligosaccharide flippase family protein [Acetobacteraceae bacterium]|jgi:O-antigen/teichoic acid export membrane protein|nr:oligosaccharide flippase family protein [Acetobacteraceae bacterium]